MTFLNTPLTKWGVSGRIEGRPDVAFRPVPVLAGRLGVAARRGLPADLLTPPK